MFFFNEDFIYIIPAVIIGFTVHEFFHAYISLKFGDYTAKEEGRVTLNPMKHVDMIGLILILALGFGWAKPVPINPRYYKNPAVAIPLISLAGPLSNLAIAIIAIGLNLIIRDGTVALFLIYLWMINLGMCIFNLIPIPPLDGSKIFGYLINGNDYTAFLQYERYGFIVLIVMMYLGVFSYIMNPVFDFVFNFLYP